MRLNITTRAIIFLQGVAVSHLGEEKIGGLVDPLDQFIDLCLICHRHVLRELKSKVHQHEGTV